MVGIRSKCGNSEEIRRSNIVFCNKSLAWSPDKQGRDVGELCGLEPIGVRALADIDTLLALQPDCVLYTPQFPDLGVMVQILEAGINLVSTSYFITGRSFGPEEAERLEAAALRGGVSLYGTGINPGFANLFALLSSVTAQLETTIYGHDPLAEMTRLTRALLEAFPGALDDVPSLTMTPGAQHLLAGITMAADWMGSDADRAQ